MAVTQTAKLKLQKPDNDELTSPTLLNTNMDKLENAPGLSPVTSLTRPTNPYPGQRIIEQDKKRVLRWSGTHWLPVWPKPAVMACPTAGVGIDYPTAGVWQKLILTTVTSEARADPWEMLDVANGRINLLWPGTYSTQCHWMTQGGINAGFLFAVSIFKNGILIAQFNTHVTTTSIGQTPGPLDIPVVAANAGDYLEYYAYFDVNFWDIQAPDGAINHMWVQYLAGP